MASTPVITGHATHGYPRRGKASGHAADDGGGSTTVKALSEGSVSKGKGTAASRSGVPLIDGDAFSLHDIIYPLRAQIGTSTARIAVEGSSAARSLILIFFSYCTVAFLFSVRDSHSLGLNFSQISIATCPNLCSKVVELHTSYNIAIAILRKFLLVQA